MVLMENRSYNENFAKSLESIVSTENLKKSFDLNGINNDELLRLYLRKAGLSDQIECLMPEQRRAFIYDIVKSDLPPGQWQPSTMKAATVPRHHSRPIARPPDPPSISHVRNDSGPVTSFPKSNMGIKSSSTNSLKMLSVGGSPKLPPRFIPAPQTPPSPSTFVTSAAGKKYEISSPTQFRHVSGDITRDRTRHAFDLTFTMDDNVLRKYLFENGITEDEVKDIPKQELITKIVQSKFRWMPPRRQQSEENLAQTSNYVPSPQPSITSFSSWSSSSTVSILPTKTIIPNQTANFELVAWRFNEPSTFPAPENLTSAKISQPMQQQKSKKSIMVSVNPAPPPPPRKSKVLPPPPRPPTSADVENVENYHEIEETYEKPDYYDEPRSYEKHNYMDVIPNPPPLPPSLARKDSVQVEAYETPSPIKDNIVFSVPPHMPVIQQDNYAQPPELPPQVPPPPPPPPPPTKPNKTEPLTLPAKATKAKANDDGDGDSRDALLESIRNGISLKKVSANKKAATVSGTKMHAVQRGQIDFLSELKMGVTLRNAKLNDESCA